jgi:hypothetical protein
MEGQMRRKLRRCRIENARTVIMVRAFWLVRSGGQGRGRTADLPLFRGPLIADRTSRLTWLNTCQQGARLPFRHVFGTIKLSEPPWRLAPCRARPSIELSAERLAGAAREPCSGRLDYPGHLIRPRPLAPVAVWHPYWVL